MKSVKIEDISGSFLQGRPDIAPLLIKHGSERFPRYFLALSDQDSVTRDSIISTMKENSAMAEGYWMVALGALVASYKLKHSLPEAPEDIQSSIEKITKTAITSNPELFEREDFLSACVEIVQMFEDAAKEPESNTKQRSTIDPIEIGKSGHSPSIRIRSGGNGKAVAYAHYSLLDDNGEAILSGEYSAEDLTFIAASALSACKATLKSAISTVKEDRLVREGDDSMVDERIQGIMADALEVGELLRRIAIS